MKDLSSCRTVFLSSTNLGLKDTRAAIANMLRVQGIEPIEEQVSLQPESVKVRREIRSLLDQATGALCLVGPYYGYPMEPLNTGQSRRWSYTQWECVLALKKGRGKCRVYLLEDEYFEGGGRAELIDEVDPKFPDSKFFREWQNRFRDYVRENHQYSSIRSEVELWRTLAMTNWRDWPEQ